MTPGEKPTGAPETVTVPVTVPGPEAHPLESELPDPELPDEPEQQVLELSDEPELPLEPELPEHVVVLSSRLARLPRPIPEATWGRTVTRSTKPATAIITNRTCLRQRFMGRPSFMAGAAAPACLQTLLNVAHSCLDRCTLGCTLARGGVSVSPWRGRGPGR